MYKNLKVFNLKELNVENLCDLIAEGIIQAVAEVNTEMPVVARLEGNRADIGNKKLKTSGLNIIPASSFLEAAKLAVSQANDNKD